MSSQEPSGLTNAQICESAMDFTIEKYLELSEIKQDMLDKFNGSKVNLVQYLRKREALPKNEPSPLPVEEALKPNEVKLVTSVKKRVVKKKESPNNQNELF